MNPLDEDDRLQPSINLSYDEYFFLYAPGHNFCSSEVSFL